MRIRLPRFVILAFATAAVLSGCAAGSSYDDSTADDLQARVLAVTEAVGASDYAAANARLTELSAAADDALAKGEVSAERHDSILAAAALVQTDVDAAIAAAEAQAAQAAEAERQRLAAEEAARQAAEDEDDDGPGGGPGNDKGKKDD